MKTKEQAAKILLDAGWTLEEANAVLDGNKVEIVIRREEANPMPCQPIVIQPSPWPQPSITPVKPFWEYPWNPITISDSGTVTSSVKVDYVS